MRRIALSVLPLLVLLAGCGSKASDGPSAPMGDGSPAFAGDLKTFPVGTWCAVEEGSTNLNKRWIFKGDGTFVFHTEDEWRAGGKWTVNDRVIMLEYVTMDGLPWNDARAKVQKAAEGGGQGAVAESLGMEWYFDKMPNQWDSLVIDEDKKHMVFSRTPVDDKPAEPDPNAPPADPNAAPDLSSIDINSIMGSGVQLERMK